VTETILSRLIGAVLDDEARDAVLGVVAVRDEVAKAGDGRVSRATLAQAMNLVLLEDLLRRVPTGRAYVQDVAAEGRKLIFDHGALRTVDLAGMGDLPPGEAAITRILEPLGYRLAGVYPLDRLGMTGRAYAHEDHPEDVPQFFLSELHPARFPEDFQAAVARVTASSRDPLDAGARARLERLRVERSLDFDDAAALLPRLVACFARRHAPPSRADYELLRASSAEMAWIATEGNAFNHATDRVRDLDAVVAGQRRLQRPLKDKIEVSGSGRVRQTAFRADPVSRPFLDADGAEVREVVPGSFFEFIQRGEVVDETTGALRLDLAFDSGNAQGIFKMTAGV
jgi:hypothetical protein